MAIARRAARLLVFDPERRVLLMRGTDPGRPDAGSWWFTPGGAVDPGETAQYAALRELREETGIVLEHLGPVMFRRRTRFEFEGVTYEQEEEYFSGTVTTTELDSSGWTDVERRSLLEMRWWPLTELRETPETVYPLGLAEVVEEHLARGV